MKYICLIFVSLILLAAKVPFWKHSETTDNVSIRETIYEIKEKRLDESILYLKNGSKEYQDFSNLEAQLLHLLGHLSNIDGACIIVGIDWYKYEISSTDSIITWYENNEYYLHEDSVKKWLKWQSEYYKFMCSNDYCIGVLANSMQNWSDSIGDEWLKRELLYSDGSWKLNYIDSNWLTLDPNEKENIQRLIELLPQSELVKNKLLADSLELQYYYLADKFKTNICIK